MKSSCPSCGQESESYKHWAMTGRGGIELKVYLFRCSRCGRSWKAWRREGGVEVKFVDSELSEGVHR